MKRGPRHQLPLQDEQQLAAGRGKVSFKSIAHVPAEGHTSTNRGQHRLDLMGMKIEDTELDGLGRRDGSASVGRRDEYDQITLYKLLKE